MHEVTVSADAEEARALLRKKVEFLETELRQMPPVEIPVKHYFALNTYAREITIPKGTIITGKIHKTEQLNILSKGEMSVLTDGGVVRVRAPFTVVSPADTKCIAYTHEECVWTTIHGTASKDVDEIEALFVAQNDQEYLVFAEAQQALLEG